MTILGFFILCIQQLVWLTVEVRGAGVNKLVLFQSWQTQTWHLFEFEVRSVVQSIVELLLRELVHSLECNGERHIVVMFNSGNFAPEKDLISLNSCSQLTECHLQLHSLVEIESSAIVLEVLKLFR